MPLAQLFYLDLTTCGVTTTLKTFKNIDFQMSFSVKTYTIIRPIIIQNRRITKHLYISQISGKMITLHIKIWYHTLYITVYDKRGSLQYLSGILAALSGILAVLVGDPCSPCRGSLQSLSGIPCNPLTGKHWWHMGKILGDSWQDPGRNYARECKGSFQEIQGDHLEFHVASTVWY